MLHLAPLPFRYVLWRYQRRLVARPLHRVGLALQELLLLQGKVRLLLLMLLELRLLLAHDIGI